jgi:hypothetical protein
MPLLAVHVSLRSTTGLPQDDVVNVLHYTTTVLTNFGTITSRVADAYANAEVARGGINQVKVCAYNQDDAKPRAPQNCETRTLSGSGGTPGPREVSLCLSMYGDRNLPRKRGRIYIGPFASAQMGERPSATLMAGVLNLGYALRDPSGSDFEWVIYSPTSQSTTPVQNLWVDNEWDTQRRRGLKGTTRQTLAV